MSFILAIGGWASLAALLRYGCKRQDRENVQAARLVRLGDEGRTGPVSPRLRASVGELELWATCLEDIRAARVYRAGDWGGS